MSGVGLTLESLLTRSENREKSGAVTCDYENNLCTMSEGAIRLSTEENAGGSSTLSEAHSLNLIQQILPKVLLKETEKQIGYRNPGGKITDYTIWFQECKFGVQVTRAMYRPKDRQSASRTAPVKRGREQVVRKRLAKEMEKKLKGIQESSRNACDPWEKQILHVWCQDNTLCEIVRDVFDNADTGLRGNTILLTSQVQGQHLWETIFYNTAVRRFNTHVSHDEQCHVLESHPVPRPRKR